jgi:alpha-1,3-rhamnosyl/mannosyltransferase
VAGGWGWQASKIAEYLDNVAKPRGVRHLGYVADSDLPGLYSAARALVFPSHYEGFGLPPLEMLATGGAVLASTAGVHREVLANHAAYIAPDDLDGWRDALRRAIVDGDWIRQLREGGQEHAAGFTWQKCAKQTVEVYSKVLAQKLAA